MKKVPNAVILTSTARGLAHYVVHLYSDLKPMCNPYYVIYRDQ